MRKIIIPTEIRLKLRVLRISEISCLVIIYHGVPVIFLISAKTFTPLQSFPVMILLVPFAAIFVRISPFTAGNLRDKGGDELKRTRLTNKILAFSFLKKMISGILSLYMILVCTEKLHNHD